MAKDVTLADIAAKVGVSTVAVSKALSGKPGVSDELRARIRQVADRMGYKASASEKPAVVKTGNIGVIVPENYYGYSFSFYGQLYEKVVKALYDNRYYGILELLTKEDENENNIPKVLRDGKVDGLIFMGQMKENYIRKMVAQSEVPVFFLDTYRPSIMLDTVISDGYYGTYLLTDYLIRRGHRKIGFVGNIEATDSIADRFWGYRKALRENDIKFESDWEIPDRSRYGNIGDRILDRRIGIAEAYVCNCDYAAQVVIQDLEEMGYTVPEDVSVVGFDDFLPIGRGMDKDQITSYSVNMEQMAVTCVHSLIRKIEHQNYIEGVQIVTGKMVEKKTVKDRR
ncbi:MAG: LacI family DNA-binding transcriptional regulator [Lachnospiraceae bacterium]